MDDRCTATPRRVFRGFLFRSSANLFRGACHPQGDLGDALAHPANSIEAAFVFSKFIALRLHRAAPVISRASIAHKNHSLRNHEHDQLLEDEFHPCVTSSADGNSTADLVLQREAALSESKHSLEELLQRR